jgi:DNA gyrase subunit A
MAQAAERIEAIDIEEEVRTSFLDYAMSVIVARALPDVRDGLKPVHRRILWGMLEQGIRPDRPTKKSARIVGDVMGKYHPHGPDAIYDALVRMGQDFSLRYPLIDGQGNFGSIEGDPPGAPRYTEARLGPLAMEMLRGIDAETVDFQPNYDGEEREPIVLPGRFPMLLVNGASGIAVGMATNIPPHNLSEAIDGVIAAIDKPDITSQQLMRYIKGPDFPTGGIIMGKDGIKEYFKTGRGSVRVRGRVVVEEDSRGRQKLVITEVPFQVNPLRVAEKCEELRQAKRIPEIAAVRNESSNRSGMRIVVELSRNANPQIVLNKLYKNTQFQESFGVINLALVDGVPRTLSLVETVQPYIAHQVEVVTRRTRFELRQAEERDHIVAGLLIALDNLDAVIKVIRGSADTDEARDKLMKRFKLSEIQANHILDMPLRRLTRLERQKLQDEHKELVATIKRLKALLKDPRQIRGVIKDELKEIKAKYGDGRRTEIRADEGEIDLEDLITEQDVVITVSRAGYVKRLPVETYRRQGRGGRGVRGANLKEEDVIAHAFTTTTRHWLLFFTSSGKVYRVKAHEVPEGTRTARGTYAANLPGVALTAEEKIAAVIPLKGYDDARYVVFATKKGLVKKTPLVEYDSPRAGLQAITLKKGDQLIGVKLTNGRDDVVLTSRAGQALRFAERETRPMGRAAAGVIGMRLRSKDEVIALSLAGDGQDLVTISQGGFGKRTPVKEYPRKGRGGLGIVTHKLTSRTGQLAGAFIGSKDQDVFVISSGGIVIRVGAAEIRKTGRPSQGVRVMKMDGRTKVAAVAPVVTQVEA